MKYRVIGDERTVIIPPLQDLGGKSGSSGKRVFLSERQTNRKPTCFFAASSELVVGDPTVILNPWKIVSLLH
jgi:hypothetical protein